jgi:hypothetical protein
VAAERFAALHRAGGPELALADAVAEGVSDGVPCAVGEAAAEPGLAELVAGGAVGCAWGWLGPHPPSISAAAAAAVVMTNPCEIRCDLMAPPLRRLPAASMTPRGEPAF